MKTTTSKDSLWITNISNKDISLTDLNLTIRSFTTINLLDTKHYNLTREQLEKSCSSGSIFKRKDKIFVRKVAPENNKPHFINTATTTFKTKKRSGIEVIPIRYEELDIPDTIYADENSDIAEQDRSPMLTKK